MVVRSARGLLFSLLCLPALAAAQDPDDARGWLERMREAVRERNYIGTFVYRHRGQLETLRIIHRAGPGGERERLYSLNGSAREIIRDNDKVTCILPDDKSVLVDNRPPGNPFADWVPEDIAALGEHYEFRLGADGRIAGRPAKALHIRPRDNYRYGYQLWLDKASGLMLGASLHNDAGEAVEQLLFTSLDTPQSIDEALLQPGASGEGFTWYRGQERGGAGSSAEDASAWSVAKLPPGFTLLRRYQHEGREATGPREHLLFSDGLASVSVYIEPLAGMPVFDGMSRMGAVNAYGRQLDDHQITAMGEVPAATVRAIANAVRRIGGGG
ncbi:MucB/RseB C-terminal domain-containing protein [Alkalilimnicola sp. S0819]|uniref:MucB/RseB C-terminal domain-containing protein n=1 Tax=Alkalilimnicola sp. S0819 TaxID=2613922 RepID=UPI0012628C3F|nr:MucB/RseB C-terminal domain-containing protein [Alkalilimnicola sp. S0819]KAB7627554.1 transcriptional regulator [Alkalilimnicola sp. S0819]MPQ15710.1 transcriptional regulator [Alkalilimnicola sp. S0819]